MTRSVSVARSSGAWPLSLIGSSLLTLCLVGCAGSLPVGIGEGGSSGSGGSGGGTGGMSGADSGVPGCDTTGIFSTHMCTSLCHAAANAAAFGGFDMTTTGWDKKLVGGMPAASAATSLCKGMNKVYLVAGMQPATGLFIDKVKLANPGCGVQMPQALPPLSDTEIACVQMWANSLVAGGSGK